MTEVPSEYEWSSYRANASNQANYKLNPHPVYLGLGENSQERQRSYRELFRNAISEEQLHEIRNSLNQELVLGREDFRKHIEAVLNRKLEPGIPGRPRKINECVGVYSVY